MVINKSIEAIQYHMLVWMNRYLNFSLKLNFPNLKFSKIIIGILQIVLG